MPENDRLSGCLDEIDVEFVEREATPQLLLNVSIQLHLAVLSLSNTVLFLEVFGVNRARPTVHNWVHKADLQPESGRSPAHVAVDETVIQIDDQRYWLYAAVEPESNELLHKRLEMTRTNVLVERFFGELRQKHDVDDAVFLVDDATPLKEACQRHGLDFRDRRHGNRTSVERVFREIKRRTYSFSIFSATPIKEPSPTGSDHSLSHGIGLSDSMEMLLSLESLEQDMGRKRPTAIPCRRPRLFEHYR